MMFTVVHSWFTVCPRFLVFHLLCSAVHLLFTFGSLLFTCCSLFVLFTVCSLLFTSCSLVVYYSSHSCVFVGLIRGRALDRLTSVRRVSDLLVDCIIEDLAHFLDVAGAPRGELPRLEGDDQSSTDNEGNWCDDLPGGAATPANDFSFHREEGYPHQALQLFCFGDVDSADGERCAPDAADSSDEGTGGTGIAMDESSIATVLCLSRTGWVVKRVVEEGSSRRGSGDPLDGPS